MSIVDYEDGDRPDPGSAAAELLLHMADFNPPGEFMADIPLGLIVPAPGQRDRNDAWVGTNQNIGWIEALGHGIVLNEVPLDAYPQRKSAMENGDFHPWALDAMTAAREADLDSVYEVIIGQHRVRLALACGLVDLDAYVLTNISEHDCAKLFVQDARTTRPLRGYDVHKAALVYGEPRALTIQSQLDQRGIKLVPASPRSNQVSCIRALEKACGDPATSAQNPDAGLLEWHLSVLTETFPNFQWPDPLVQGLTMRAAVSDISGADPVDLGHIAFGHWKGNVKLAVQAVRTMRQVTTSANPQAASQIWSTLFTAAGIPPKAPKKAGPRPSRRAVRKVSTGRVTSGAHSRP